MMFQLYKYDTSLVQLFLEIVLPKRVFHATEDLLLACSTEMFGLVLVFWFCFFFFLGGGAVSACLVVEKLVPCLFTWCCVHVFFLQDRGILNGPHGSLVQSIMQQCLWGLLRNVRLPVPFLKTPMLKVSP